MLLHHGDVVQLVERLICIQEVESSNLFISTQTQDSTMRMYQGISLSAMDVGQVERMGSNFHNKYMKQVHPIWSVPYVQYKIYHDATSGISFIVLIILIVNSDELSTVLRCYVCNRW